MIIRNYPITTDNVRNVGGKDMILTRMVNHYTALSQIKSVLNTTPPHALPKKTFHQKKGDLNRQQQFHNVRETYKKVSNVSHYVDDKKPSTYYMKPKNCFKNIKEKYAEIEHLRTLKAMSKRILSIGKMHERKKNRYDPIANPTYFFLNAQRRDPNSEATKLISLKNLNEMYEKLNDKKRNKLLLGNEVYNAVEDIDVDNWIHKCKKNIKRPKSAAVQNNIINYDTKIRGQNSTLVEYNPQKFLEIHKFRRENEGDKIVKRRKQKQEEKNKKNKSGININSSKSKYMTFKSKIIKGMLSDDIPMFSDIEPNGENNGFNKFKEDILQFIIANKVFKDEDYDALIGELVKKNANNNNINRTIIEKIVLELKNEFDN